MGGHQDAVDVVIDAGRFPVDPIAVELAERGRPEIGVSMAPSPVLVRAKSIARRSTVLKIAQGSGADVERHAEAGVLERVAGEVGGELERLRRGVDRRRRALRRFRQAGACRVGRAGRDARAVDQQDAVDDRRIAFGAPGRFDPAAGSVGPLNSAAVGRREHHFAVARSARRRWRSWCRRRSRSRPCRAASDPAP